jgi:hypothetical protein
MDVVLISRIQSGLTTAFHIVFPILSIGPALQSAISPYAILPGVSVCKAASQSQPLSFYPLGALDFSRDPGGHHLRVPGN